MTYTSATVVLMLTLAACSAHAAVTAKPRSFEEEKAEAERNVRTEAGSKYDRALGEYLQSLPGFAKSMDKCMDGTAPPHAVRGYFRFDAHGEYRVVLRPSGEFATCISAAFEGHKPPTPPKLPYLNDFNFGVAE